MRPDIAKVICEDARRGSRDNTGLDERFNKHFRFRDRQGDDYYEEYAKLDALPRKAGMRSRVKINHGEMRDFSENLGVLRGLIIKNVGKNWDKLYSELCQLASPSGSNIKRHVHQHLHDYIETETKLIDDIVYVHDISYFRSGDSWLPLKDYINDGRSRYFSRHMGGSFYYYVHPKTRCIARIKLKANAKANNEPEKTFIRVSNGVCFAKMKGCWWELKMVKNYMVEKVEIVPVFNKDGQYVRDEKGQIVRQQTVKMVERYTDVVWKDLDFDYLRFMVGRYRYTSDDVYGGTFNVAIGKRQINSNELRKLGVSNDIPKEPKWELTKSGWKNVA